MGAPLNLGDSECLNIWILFTIKKKKKFSEPLTSPPTQDYMCSREYNKCASDLQ